jgi:DNA polymerase (family 10)
MNLDRKTAARALREIASLLEVQGENVHRVRALANASRIVERIDGDLGAMVRSGEILELKGIGKGTASILEQLADGNRPDVLEEADKAVPPGVREMMTIPGLGPKKVRALWMDLGLTSLGELEYACRENRLVELTGFGAKTQSKLIDAIRFARMAGDRRLISEAWSDAEDLAEWLAAVDGVDEVRVAGEVRRLYETVGSLDLVAVARHEEIVGEAVTNRLESIEKKKPGMFIGRTGDGFVVRVRVASPNEAGAALLWATGSDQHLAALVERATGVGLDLDENGLRQDGQMVERGDELAIYEALGCQWVPPELRESGDSVNLAIDGSLPELVTVDDMLGVLHNHTTDSDGAATVEEMAAAAGEKGWDFFGVADHSPVAVYANGLSADRLRDQWRRIDEFNARGAGPRVVKGLEADILTDGSLDIPDGCESGLEYVVASVHSSFRLSEEEQTERIVRAVSHPACRVLGARSLCRAPGGGRNQRQPVPSRPRLALGATGPRPGDQVDRQPGCAFDRRAR